MKKAISLTFFVMLMLRSAIAQDIRGMEYKDWMSYVQDSTPVCQLTIPGAHDAGTHWFPIYFCNVQSRYLHELFNAGIRAFDIRVGAAGLTTFYFEDGNAGLGLFHGPIYLTKSFRGAMQLLYDKLGENPSEFIVVQISIEHDSWFHDIAKHMLQSYFRTSYSEQVTDTFTDWDSEEQYNAAKSLWLTDWRPDITVGEMRGKVLFMFQDWITEENDFTYMPGIYTGGIGNTEFDTPDWRYPSPSGVQQCSAFGQNMYDSYKLNRDLDYKLRNCIIPCCEQFTQECTEHPENYTWCQNMTSGYVKMGLSNWCSTELAGHVNNQFARYLAEHPETYVGIAMGDWLADFYGYDVLVPVSTGGLSFIEALISNNRRFWKPELRKDKRTPFVIPSNP